MIKLKKILLVFLTFYLFIFVVKVRSVSSYLDKLEKALIANDFEKQKEILGSVYNDEQFKEVINKIFKDDKDKILDFLVLPDNTKIIKSYFDIQQLSELDYRYRKPLLEKSLAAGSLGLVTKLIKKLDMKITNKMLINNFDSIARETNLEQIKGFVEQIKKIGLLDVLLEERSVYDNEKDMQALIHHVAKRCNMDWLKVLIENGVVVTLQDRKKNTPIHEAVLTLMPNTLNNKVDFINYMLNKRNIEVLYKNREDKTAHDLAKEYLARYQKMHKQAKGLIFKEQMQKRVKVYTKLVDILGKLHRG